MFPFRRRQVRFLTLSAILLSPVVAFVISSPPTIRTTSTTTTTHNHHHHQQQQQQHLHHHPYRQHGSVVALFCQLLGMNCAQPTDFTFSFQGFCKRGGETDVHADGWGLAFYQDGGIRQFHDVEAASTSPLAKYLGQQPIQTVNMMGHIRYATQGQVNLANVHPFSREMWGIIWCFCHNGEIPYFSRGQRPKLTSLGCSTTTTTTTTTTTSSKMDYYNPVGTTDSEATFCAILNALRCKFTTLPSLPILHEAIQEVCAEIVQHDPQGTIFNFLLTCGPHTQWVYSWPGQRPGSKVWNGLHYTTVREYPCSYTPVHLADMNMTVDFFDTTTTTSTTTTLQDCVSIIATKPLTDEGEWTEIQRGQLIVFDQGKPYQTPYELFELELKGHGLESNVLQKPCLEVDMRQYNLELSQFQGACI